MPQVTQGIRGRIVDAKTGEAVIEAQVSVIGQTKKSLTNLDGYFGIELPPGTYSLRSFYELYEAARVENIVVEPGKVAEVEIKLAPQSTEVEAQEEFVVVARADRATDATQLQIRKESAGVRDAVSAQEISRSGASNAADAVRRVVSATVDPNNKLIVRGLGSRYTRTLMYGFRIPSTDPDDPGVELDLFPAGALSNLAVVKTFTPDLPGDFAGGVLQVETRDFPDHFMLQANVALGYNTQSTFKPVLDYEGSKTDWLGFDNGTRALPSAVPSDRVSARAGIGEPPPKYTQDEANEIGKSFPNTWSIAGKTGAPQGTMNLVLGDTLRVAKRNLGYLAAFSYRNATERRVSNVRIQQVAADGESTDTLTEANKYTDERGRRSAQWGALGTLNYEVSPSSDLTLTSLFSQSGINDTNYAEGVSDNVLYAQRRLRWYERQLWLTQLRGQHREIEKLNKLTVDWVLSLARTNRYEPDTRAVRYIREMEDQPYQWGPSDRSPRRLFSNLTDWTVGSQIDFALPIVDDVKAKFGAQTRNSFDEFRQRRFGLNYNPTEPPADPLAFQRQGPEEIFDPNNIGPILQFAENTTSTDGYDATSGLYAGYAMLDVTPIERLRLIGGARLESFRQELDANSPTGPAEEQPGVDGKTLDVLPSGAAVITLAKDMYLRANYGMTLARPLFRELALFVYEDDIRGVTVSGNPKLESSSIHNVDARWELFPSGNEVLAFTGFYKKFIKPIEPYDTGAMRSYQNAKDAQNLGAEFEARVSLGRIHKALNLFSSSLNFTYVWSRITIADTPDQTVANTNKTRPLSGQSPYVVNLSLGFADPDSGSSLFVYYNVFGKRIDQVGASGLPDQYELPFHSLDIIGNYALNPHWALRLTTKNTLFQDTRIKEGSIIRERYNPGTVITLGAQFTY